MKRKMQSLALYLLVIVMLTTSISIPVVATGVPPNQVSSESDGFEITPDEEEIEQNETKKEIENDQVEDEQDSMSVSQNDSQEDDEDSADSLEEDEKELDYIKGRPLTEDEIKEQNSHIPPLTYQSIGFTFPSQNHTNSRLRSGVASSIVRYDPREIGMVTSVKDQKETGLCWAFTSVAMAEIAALKNKYVNNTVDFSENHLGYFFYNRQPDVLRGTEGDYNSARVADYVDNGGNTLLAAFALSTWSGLAEEGQFPFTGFYSAIPPQYAYSSSIKLKNAYFLEKNINEIKNAVYQYGAVGVGIGYYIQFHNYNTAAYYNDSWAGTNHAVTIVGWDDQYSKENFSTVPKYDGAWIVKNSWSRDWGDDGYFYLSYEDYSMENPIAFEVMPVNTYQNNYQYDGTSSTYASGVYNGGKIANIFKANASSQGYDELLRAVQFAPYDTNINYSVQIYRNLTDLKNPESGVAMLSSPVTGTTNAMGIYTIDLGQDLLLASGDTYSVVITLTGKSTIYFFVDKSADYNWILMNSSVKPGQSFIKRSSNNIWYDSYNVQSNIRIKAFTKNTNTKTIRDMAITKVNISQIKDQSYTGKSIKPKLTLTYSDTTFQSGADYSISYKNNKKIGKATITIHGKGRLRGSRIVTFNIVPKRTTIRSAKAIGSRKVKVAWKKNSMADGYKIQLSMDKNFKKGIKSVMVKKRTTLSTTVSKLKKKKRYYVRVCAYKKVGSKRYYGSYSKVKSIRVK